MRSGTKINVAVMVGTIFLFAASVSAQRQMEKLGRGVVAVNLVDGKIYVG